MQDFEALKAISRAREHDEKRTQERKRNIIVLILRHLCDCGYTDTYERLCSESNCSLTKYDVADNVDLEMLLQEFENNYETKFGKRPKVVRKVAEEGRVEPNKPLSAAGRRANPGNNAAGKTTEPPTVSTSALEGPPVSGALAARERRERGAAHAEHHRPESTGRRAALPARGLSAQEPRPAAGDASAQTTIPMQVTGANVRSAQMAGGKNGASSDSDPEEFFARRTLKPLPPWLHGEMRELGSALQREIALESPNVRWDDIAGLEEAKKLLKEAVVQPIKYPELFTGLLAPWKGVLLYGPPGTGKTMLARAVATECRTTFFNISASAIISKWRGDSEKLVRVLFDLARYYAPSTIFLDELDALMMARGGEGEHEASRRMKTELLIQMDGLNRSGELVFVLGATNLPWELDMALLRRLEKRILVPLPCMEARRRMFEALLKGRTSADVSPELMAERTEGYSGSDAQLVAKEAAMRPLRRLMQRLESASGAQLKMKPEVGPITVEDVQGALAVTKATARAYDAQYKQFTEEYGQVT